MLIKSVENEKNRWLKEKFAVFSSQILKWVSIKNYVMISYSLVTYFVILFCCELSYVSKNDFHAITSRLRAYLNIFGNTNFDVNSGERWSQAERSTRISFLPRNWLRLHPAPGVTQPGRMVGQEQWVAVFYVIAVVFSIIILNKF